jgi:CRP-like cAMP-binding protein
MLEKIGFLKSDMPAGAGSQKSKNLGAVDPLTSVLTELVHTMPSNSYEAGALLLRPGEPSETVMLLDSGIVEIYVYLSGIKFVIDRLFPGSVINYRNILLEEEPA